MFLQNTIYQTANILGDAQARYVSQGSVRMKNTFQYMNGQVQKTWKPLEREIIFHKQQMEIKPENGAYQTIDAIWKRQKLFEISQQHK
jgi:hypothetical protein